MKFFFLSVFFLSFYISISAQEHRYTTEDKQAIKYYALAGQDLDEHLYDQAVENLLKAIEEDPKFIEAHIQLADIYRAKWKYKEAADQYQQAINLNTDFNQFIYYKIGDCQIRIAAYADAERNLETYLAFANLSPQSAFLAQKLLSDCKFSLDALKHPVEFIPENLGPAINTGDDEYFPAITADENTLIFTRQIKNNEDFYKSVKVGRQMANSNTAYPD